MAVASSSFFPGPISPSFFFSRFATDESKVVRDCLPPFSPQAPSLPPSVLRRTLNGEGDCFPLSPSFFLLPFYWRAGNLREFLFFLSLLSMMNLIFSSLPQGMIEMISSPPPFLFPLHRNILLRVDNGIRPFFSRPIFPV